MTWGGKGGDGKAWAKTDHSPVCLNRKVHGNSWSRVLELYGLWFYMGLPFLDPCPCLEGSRSTRRTGKWACVWRKDVWVCHSGGEWRQGGRKVWVGQSSKQRSGAGSGVLSFQHPAQPGSEKQHRSFLNKITYEVFSNHFCKNPLEFSQPFYSLQQLWTA